MPHVLKGGQHALDILLLDYDVEPRGLNAEWDPDVWEKVDLAGLRVALNILDLEAKYQYDPMYHWVRENIERHMDAKLFAAGEMTEEEASFYLIRCAVA